MKSIFRYILQWYLKCLTKLALSVHRPFVVAIAGSANKTFFKEAINEKLRQEGLDIRSNPKSFNTRIGLPLAILDLPSGYHSYFIWLPIIFKAPLKIFQKFSDILILEFGVWNRGDMRYLLSIIKPDIAVITDITQKYLEAFSGLDELWGEYGYLAGKIDKKGLLVLNYDNAKIKEIGDCSAAAKKYFSLEQDRPDNVSPADFYRAFDIKKEPDGQSAIIKNEKEERVKISRFGRQHFYALLASLAVSDRIKNR